MVALSIDHSTPTRNMSVLLVISQPDVSSALNPKDEERLSGIHIQYLPGPQVRLKLNSSESSSSIQHPRPPSDRLRARPERRDENRLNACNSQQSVVLSVLA